MNGLKLGPKTDRKLDYRVRTVISVGISLSERRSKLLIFYSHFLIVHMPVMLVATDLPEVSFLCILTTNHHYNYPLVRCIHLSKLYRIKPTNYGNLVCMVGGTLRHVWSLRNLSKKSDQPDHTSRVSWFL